LGARGRALVDPARQALNQVEKRVSNPGYAETCVKWRPASVRGVPRDTQVEKRFSTFFSTGTSTPICANARL